MPLTDAMDVLKLTTGMDQQRHQNIAGAITGAFNAASQSLAQVSNVYGQVTNAALNFEQMRLDTMSKAESFKITREGQALNADIANKNFQLASAQFEEAKFKSDRDYLIAKANSDSGIEKDKAMAKYYLGRNESIEANKPFMGHFTAQATQAKLQKAGISSKIAYHKSRVDNLDKQLANQDLLKTEDIPKLQAQRDLALKEMEAAAEGFDDVIYRSDAFQDIHQGLATGLLSHEDAQNIIMNDPVLSKSYRKPGELPPTATGAPANAPVAGRSVPIQSNATGDSSIKTTPSPLIRPQDSDDPSSFLAVQDGEGFEAVVEPVKPMKRDYASTKVAIEQRLRRDGEKGIATIPQFIAQNASDEAKKQLEQEQMAIAAEYIDNQFRPELVGPDRAKTMDQSKEIYERFIKAGGDPRILNDINTEVAENVEVVKEASKVTTNGVAAGREGTKTEITRQKSDIINKVFKVEEKRAAAQAAKTGSLLPDPSGIKLVPGGVDADRELAPGSVDDIDFTLQGKSVRQTKQEAADKKAREAESAKSAAYAEFRTNRLHENKLTMQSPAVRDLGKMPPKYFGVETHDLSGNKRSEEAIKREVNAKIRELINKGPKDVFEFIYKYELGHRKYSKDPKQAVDFGEWNYEDTPNYPAGGLGGEAMPEGSYNPYPSGMPSPTAGD
jgi:hypothetical protein